MVSQVKTYIASHYRKNREETLGDVLDGLSNWRDAIVDVTVMSNVATYEETGFLGAKRAAFEANGGALSLEVVDGLGNPRDLVWAHKRHLPGWVMTASPGEDFFLYIEDDICFTEENFRYFLKHRRVLEPHRLIPGFIRYETHDGRRLVVDHIHSEFWERDRSIRLDGRVYHAPINPYWAGFLMDRGMAEEYVASASFDKDRSAGVHRWGPMERSAMGLTYERPARRFRSRYVLALDAGGMPEPGCYLWHRSNTYSSRADSPQAKRTAEEIFRRESAAHWLRRKAGRALARLTRR